MKKVGSISGYLGALGLVFIASLICQAVRTSLVPTNMVMVYLLSVVLAAAKLGLRPATGGTGLGLSIAKGIVEAHKGSILAANTAEGGLMVMVKLPPEYLDENRKENDEQ